MTAQPKPAKRGKVTMKATKAWALVGPSGDVLVVAKTRYDASRSLGDYGGRTLRRVLVTEIKRRPK